jgi:hypothetical protein
MKTKVKFYQQEFLFFKSTLLHNLLNIHIIIFKYTTKIFILLSREFEELNKDMLLSKLLL